MAASLGLEPRQNDSESFVLPLHHRAVDAKYLERARGFFISALDAAKFEPPDGVRDVRHRKRPRRIEQQTGAGDGIRTRNRLFTKQVLYH